MLNLKDLNLQDMTSVAMDRAKDAASLAGDLAECWGYNLAKRSPGIAYTTASGEQVTSLDMACLMSELVKWGSIINIPEYERSGPATRVEGQIVVSPENRHGKIVGVTSNEETFNFGVRVVDMNVMDAHNVGAYRTFLLVRNGEWWKGLSTVQFQPTPQEQERLAAIAKDNKITFDYFVHPLRWTSFYGAPYLGAKVVIERLSDEMKYLRDLIGTLRSTLKLVAEPYPHTETIEEAKPREVLWVFKAEVVGQELKGTYPIEKAKPSKDLLDTLSAKKSRLSQLRDHLKFQTRATEFAFFNQLQTRYDTNQLLELAGEVGAKNNIPLAGWVKDKQWLPSLDKKTTWLLMQNVRGGGLDLRFRIRQKVKNAK